MRLTQDGWLNPLRVLNSRQLEDSLGVGTPNRVRLGEFELDLRAGELRKADGKILLQEQPFQILLMLVERRGALVDREEIRKRLWPNDTIVEFDHSIHTAIKKLRQALGDSADSPQYVETLARRGYRLMVAVEPCIEPAIASDQVPAEAPQSNQPAAAVKGLSSGAALIGKRVSHYRVLGVLGGGGMGLLYWAEDIKLGRSVALKFLPAELADDPVALERFEREARAMSALDHPNICAVHEFGEHEGRHFIVMPLLEGKTLRDRISSAEKRNSPFSINELVALALQIADGLAAAHRQGIIHRDIKPSNIFVNDSGIVKILDFGLAKRANTMAGSEIESAGIHQISSAEENAFPLLTLTRAGVALGTAAYMSPEQVRGEPLDARTDLFSFGLVLYEMATGHQAFEGATVAIVSEAVLKQSPVPARELNPGVSPDLERIINKALEKDRETRFQSAADMAAALKGLIREDRPKRRVLRWLAAGASFVVLSSIAASFWIARRPAPSLPNIKLQQLTFNSSQDPVKGGAISLDGKYLAYNDGKGMHTKQIGSDAVLSFSTPEELKGKDITWEILPQAWFPDNARFLANAHPQSEDMHEWSSKTTSIWAFSVTGGAPQKVRGNAAGFSVSPDDALISFGQNPIWVKNFSWERELWVMSPSGENAHKLFEAEAKSGLYSLNFVPGSHRVIYEVPGDSGEGIATRDLRGGSVTKLFESEEANKMMTPAWLPGGRILYAEPCDIVKMRPDSPCNLWSARMDTRTGELLEKPRQITNWVGQGMNILTSTSDGKRVALLKYFHRGTAYLADFADDRTHLLNLRLISPDEGGEDGVIGWTPDGKAIILSLNRADHNTVQKQPLDGSANETIATLEGLQQFGAVSPDGKWIIAQIVSPAWGDGETPHVVRIPMAGGTPELIFALGESSSASSSISCARSPSGLCAVGEQTPDYKQGVITAFDPVKGKGQELARFDLNPEYQAQRQQVIWGFSNDGTKLAFAPSSQGPIHIRSLRDGREQIIRLKGVTHIRGLRWAHDGKGFFATNHTKDRAEIIYMNLRGDAKVFWDCGNDCLGNPSPDGRQFEINVFRSNANLWMMENF